MGQLLILSVHIIPFILKAFTKLLHFSFRKAILFLLVLALQIFQHFILLVYILFYLLKIIWCLPIVLFLYPIDRFWGSFSHWQNVLYSIADYEILRWSQTMDWFFMHAGHRLPFMTAIIWEVADLRQGFISHSASGLLEEILRWRFAISMKMTKCLSRTVFGMGLESQIELSWQIGILN